MLGGLLEAEGAVNGHACLNPHMPAVFKALGVRRQRAAKSGCLSTCLKFGTLFLARCLSACPYRECLPAQDGSGLSIEAIEGLAEKELETLAALASMLVHNLCVRGTKPAQAGQRTSLEVHT